jgi:hypothetical protein
MTRHDANCGCPSRRTMLRSLIGGSIILPAILSEMSLADAVASTIATGGASDPLAPRPAQFVPKAKRVIFLYMSGGVSHVDSFDPKPKLIADAGKQLNDKQFIKPPNWTFKPRGKSGTQISDLFPNIAECADDLCVIRSMRGDHGNHFEATLGIHTGSFTVTRPSIGSWVSYGLGTENQKLPSFVVLAPQMPYAGGQVWGSDFLPPCHQGTRVIPGPEPIPNMIRRASTQELQDMELGLLAQLNARHLKTRGGDANLAARIRSFETAAGMQQEAPDAFDLSQETDATLELYGLDRGSTKGFAWQCLVARRLAERGVRFIELIDCGSNRNWDAHGDMETHTPLARNVDRPIAGLIRDLKSRGMLEDTLVVWTTEFGRTPFVATAEHKGREHHARVFSSWLAGAGVKPGIVYGESDEYGIAVAKDEVHVHDLHATILHLLGLNHEKLTFRHAGRDFRLTDVHGKVVKGILA